MAKVKVWFNRHFSCVAKVIREIRKSPPLSHLEFWVSHRHAKFPGFAIADHGFIEPHPLRADIYLSWVLEAVQAKEIQCLVPGHEQGLLTLNTARFAELGCRVFQAAPTQYISHLHSKDWVYHQVKDAVPLPEFHVVKDVNELTQAVEYLRAKDRSPCIKPTHSVYGLGFYQLTATEQAKHSQYQSVSQWLERHAIVGRFPTQLVMEYLPGQEYSVDIAARNGAVLALVIRQKPLKVGPQKIVQREDLCHHVEVLVKRFQLNGLINIQFKEDRLGQPKLLEINPRASGGIGMSCQAGVNLPAIAYRAFFEPDWTPHSSSTTPVIGKPVFEASTDIANVSGRYAGKFDLEFDSRPMAMEHSQISLPTGQLSVWFRQRSSFTAEELLGYGARDNRKRGFLFVSKVLGKHVRVKPSEMLRVHKTLAQQVCEILHPIQSSGIVIGMAETATGLGMGIFRELQDLTTHTTWSTYFQTTRYACQRVLDATEGKLVFEEAHSHATELSLEIPSRGSEQYQSLTTGETILLVDDEISTGNTFANLLRALRIINPSFKQVIIATLTDLSNGLVEQRLREVEGIEGVLVVSLLEGSYHFEPNEREVASRTTGAVKEDSSKIQPARWSRFSARKGISKLVNVPAELILECEKHLSRNACRIVGTNEFMDAAFQVALQLEEHGWQTTVQSTTRSPVLISHDIKSYRAVVDPYCTVTPNYIYNFELAEDENLVVVHESSELNRVEMLLQNLCQGRRCIEVDLLLERVVVHNATGM
jgi:adenine/guanine phosphoribosyltransferase-like PRPP-binding protein